MHHQRNNQNLQHLKVTVSKKRIAKKLFLNQNKYQEKFS